MQHGINCKILIVKLGIALICSIVFCCCISKTSDSGKSKTIDDFEKEVTIQFDPLFQTLNKVDMMNVTMKRAIEKYGEPISSYNFIIDQALNPFRIELYNIYSKDEYMQRTIKMKEVTWKVDSLNRFTIWYEVLNDSTTVAKDSCSYNKFTCF